MTIEERAEQKAWEFEPTDMLQYNVYVDAYVDGATDQQKIDVEKAWKWMLEHIHLIGSPMELHMKFKQAMEE